ncbi:GntR family transcriptional regulator [Nocardiopsis sp. NPDC050513]|uniref:GntR family transcriptional regulator n=1 Tax=Nocardiopsis sp. NPDC050513 TaxID=3364338 RepID=UPI0037A2AAC6
MSTPQQPYMRVLQDLREELSAGRLRPGDRYPSINTLARNHDVATVTARRALEKLRDEGRAASQQGVGWFVTDPSSAEPTVEDRLQELTDRLAHLEDEVAALRRRASA